MGNETDLEINRFQRFDIFVASCRGAPDDSGSKINQIWSTIDDDSRARACALRIRQRSSCAQKHHLSLSRGFLLCQRWPKARRNEKDYRNRGVDSRRPALSQFGLVHHAFTDHLVPPPSNEEWKEFSPPFFTEFLRLILLLFRLPPV